MKVMSGKKLRTIVSVSVAGFGLILLPACGPELSATMEPVSPESEAVVVITPQPEEGAVEVDTPFNVSVNNGRLVGVDVKNVTGEGLVGEMSPDQQQWVTVSGGKLPFSAEYVVNVAAVDTLGRPVNVSEKITTVSPQNTVTPGTRYVTDGQTYGVGMPIVVNFKTPVTKKVEVEKKLQVASSTPVVGAWSWSENDTVATFRPQQYWPANTKIYMNGQLYGVKLNDTTYAKDDLTLDFTIGDATVMTVNPATFTLDVSVNNTPVRTIPVTIGKAGFETHEGVKVVSAKEGTITMRSAPWSSEPYVVNNVEYSMRLTDHGEYFHAAPWSEGAFGRYANSHGCISMSTTNARDLWNMTKVGDVVTVTGTGYPAQPNNGISVWNETWEQWLSKSATGQISTNPLP